LCMALERLAHSVDRVGSECVVDLGDEEQSGLEEGLRLRVMCPWSAGHPGGDLPEGLINQMQGLS
jgi:hypothetical protein